MKETENQTIKTAYELLKERKSLTLEDVMKGFDYPEITEFSVYGVYISDDVKLQLMNLGFRYRTGINQITGETYQVISLT